jgi:ribosomal protein L9
MRRLSREAKEREKERTLKEREEIDFKMKQEKLDILKNTAVGKRAFADITSEVCVRRACWGASV